MVGIHTVHRHEVAHGEKVHWRVEGYTTRHLEVGGALSLYQPVAEVGIQCRTMRVPIELRKQRGKQILLRVFLLSNRFH